MVRIIALAAALVLALSSPALGGGWAVTTLDSIPDRFDAGQTYSIGYTIRQHGVTPVSVDRTEIRIAHGESAKRLTFPGLAEGPVGHYLAKVTIPAAGSWTWEVTQGPFAAQPLGTLTVVMPAAAVAPASVTTVQAPVAPASVTTVQAPVAPVAAAPNWLLLSGLLIALAGAAVLFGGQVAAARRPARA